MRILHFLLPALAMGVAGSKSMYPRPDAPTPPSKDPWYTAPPNFEKSPPGTVFKIRHAPGNLTAIFGASAAYNILYRTTDSQYKPTWAVTTLYAPPKNRTAPEPAPFLTWLYPYDSNSIDASPSYLFYTDQPFLSDLPAAIARGWYVSVPDYEGPLASFCAGVMTGHAVLDSVRAVKQAELGVDDRNPAAMWGYSGGGLASEWAAELQVQYAPELNFVGGVWGSPVANLTVVLDNANGMDLAGLIPSFLLGLGSQYPDAQRYLIGQLKPEKRTAFLAAKNMTWTESIAAFPGQDFGTYFKNGISDVFAPEMQKAFDNDAYAGYHGVPQMPIFVYHAIHDELANITLTDALVERFCGVGANVRYERNTEGGHLEELTEGSAAAVQWLISAFDGTRATKYSATGCVIVNVTISTPT